MQPTTKKKVYVCITHVCLDHFDDPNQSRLCKRCHLPKQPCFFNLPRFLSSIYKCFETSWIIKEKFGSQQPLPLFLCFSPLPFPKCSCHSHHLNTYHEHYLFLEDLRRALNPIRDSLSKSGLESDRPSHPSPDAPSQMILRLAVVAAVPYNNDHPNLGNHLLPRICTTQMGEQSIITQKSMYAVSHVTLLAVPR